jgi:hypothetical protein
MTALDFSVIGVDSASVLAVYLWGMGSVTTAYFFGWVIGIAVDLIKKL